MLSTRQVKRAAEKGRGEKQGTKRQVGALAVTVIACPGERTRESEKVTNRERKEEKAQGI